MRKLNTAMRKQIGYFGWLYACYLVEEQHMRHLHRMNRNSLNNADMLFWCYNGFVFLALL